MKKCVGCFNLDNYLSTVRAFSSSKHHFLVRHSFPSVTSCHRQINFKEIFQAWCVPEQRAEFAQNKWLWLSIALWGIRQELGGIKVWILQLLRDQKPKKFCITQKSDWVEVLYKILPDSAFEPKVPIRDLYYLSHVCPGCCFALAADCATCFLNIISYSLCCKSFK